MEERNDKGWFSKIESPGEATRELRTNSMALFILAAFYGVYAVILGHHPFYAFALGYLVIGFCLFRYRSRLAATVFLFLSCLQLCFYIAGIAGIIGWNNNLIVVLFILWTAVRSVQATSVLAKSRP